MWRHHWDYIARQHFAVTPRKRCLHFTCLWKNLCQLIQ